MERARDIVYLIPDVKLNTAMRILKEAIIKGQHGYENLNADDRRLALYDGYGLRISPIGGRILLELFERGLIPQKTKHASQDVTDLRGYAEKENEYREQVRLADERKAAFEKRVKEIADDPSCADPSEITTTLIDRVFKERLGWGRYGELEIGGLRCHKAKTPDQLSNTGKSRYPGEVYCYWYDADGNRQGTIPVEMPKNRRNDPDRNWGLGRE